MAEIKYMDNPPRIVVEGPLSIEAVKKLREGWDRLNKGVRNDEPHQT